MKHLPMMLAATIAATSCTPNILAKYRRDPIDQPATTADALAALWGRAPVEVREQTMATSVAFFGLGPISRDPVSLCVGTT